MPMKIVSECITEVYECLNVLNPISDALNAPFASMWHQNTLIKVTPLLPETGTTS